MSIKVLDPLLANQIAAGEVVVRPASVIKELVENSIDAGATEIKIDLEGGGIKQIAVSDNGHGISKEDLPLALSRHATSKIKSIEDLDKVLSLGFRGEALASISSVSRLRLISNTEQQESAWEIQVEGRVEDFKMQPCAYPIGTKIIIQDLFFNTPARRKFLRTEKTELMQNIEVLKKILFSRFDIHFVVKHQEKVLFNAPMALTKEDQEKRIGLICGQEFISESIWIEAGTYNMALSGWITLPQFSRSQTDMQYFYVNGRIVRDKLVNHAVKLAYQDVLYNGRYPGFILFLTLPPEWVDVNVHPTKHEVRFRDSHLVHDFLKDTLEEALTQIRPKNIIEKHAPRVSHSPTQNHLEIREGSAVYQKMQSNANSLVADLPRSSFSQKELITPSDSCEEDKIQHEELGFALGQLHGIYIIAQNERGLILVDMHAAHERVVYEKLKVQCRSHSIVTQLLLVPITITLSHLDAEMVEERLVEFNQFGFELERLSSEVIVVRQVPALLIKSDIALLVKDMFAEFKRRGNSQRSVHYENEILGNIACRAAVRANTALTHNEMNILLRDLEKTPNNGVCNHGRPTWQQFTISDLDKFFLRGK